MDIKQLKPNKNSRYQQGWINPQSCKKLFESQKTIPIIYRSSLEKKYMEWCERNPDVIRWGCECVKIRYYNDWDSKYHTYNLDFVMIDKNNNKYLIEIKPLNQTKRPLGEFQRNYQWKQYITNTCKWRAAIDFCDKNGLIFKIITDKFFN